MMQKDRHTGFFLLKVKLEDYIVTIDGRNIFDKSIKDDIKTYGNAREIANG